MGGMTGAILILLMVAIGAYCYWKTSNSGKEAEQDNRSWKEKYLPWGSSEGKEQATKNPTDDTDEFNDEEVGTKSATQQPPKSWGDAFYDKVMELPSPSDLKMMMFKKGLSSRV